MNRNLPGQKEGGTDGRTEEEEEEEEGVGEKEGFTQFAGMNTYSKIVLMKTYILYMRGLMCRCMLPLSLSFSLLPSLALSCSPSSPPIWADFYF